MSLLPSAASMRNSIENSCLRREAGTALIAMQEEDILGKAYDGRLMRRMLTLPAAVPVVRRARDCAEHRGLRHGSRPSVLRQSRGRRQHRTEGLARPAHDDPALPRRDGHPRRDPVHEYLSHAMDRAADDLRSADGDLLPSAAAGAEVLRPEPDRTADHAGDQRRRSAQRHVLLRDRHGIQRRVHDHRDPLFHVLDELAAGVPVPERAAPPVLRDVPVPEERRAKPTAKSASRSHASTPSCRNTSPG